MVLNTKIRNGKQFWNWVGLEYFCQPSKHSCFFSQIIMRMTVTQSHYSLTLLSIII